MEWILPRDVPDKDSRYMGMAWIAAAFSKDPNTQVGAVLVSSDNRPLGTGYNGPPRNIDDNSFSWCRPDPDCLTAICKYDLVIHAEENAIDHSCSNDLTDATLYVTAHPCDACMLQIVKKGIARVVYTEFLVDSNSILRGVSRQKSESIATLSIAPILIEEFSGDLTWVADWVSKMQGLGLMERYKKKSDSRT